MIWIARNGKTYGPYRRDAVESYLASGQLSPSDLAWTSDMTDWRPLKEVLDSAEEAPPAGEGTQFDEEEAQSDEQEAQLDGKADLAENLTKIRRLIQKERGRHALDLVRGLDDPELYEALLAGCSIRESDWGEGQVDLPPEIDSRDGIALFLLCVGRRPPDAPAPSIRSTTKLSIHLELDGDELEPLSALENLESLELTCEGLHSDDFGFLADLPKLRELTLRELQHCDDLNFLEQCPSLKKLILTGFRGEDLGPVPLMSDLTTLYLNEFSHLAELPPLKSVDSLQSISLADCDLLKEVDALLGATKLELVDLGRCSQLENLEGLAQSKSLERVELDSCEALHDLGPLEDLVESIDFSLCRCPALTRLMGRLLRAAKVDKAVMEWHGSGDDGYCEGMFLDAEGSEMSPKNSDNLYNMMDSFIMERLPGGAEINSGSDGTLTLDFRKGTGNWTFYWTDKEKQQASDLIDQVKAEGFDRLTASLRFAFQQGEGYSEDALDEFWDENPTLHTLFYEDQQWAYLAEVELVDEGLQDNPSAESSEIDFKAFFTEFVEADSPGRYYGESIFMETMHALFDEDLDGDPRILVQGPITLTVDAKTRDLIFRRGDYEHVAEIGILEPDDEFEFKLE
ncbi:MAG: GYF domain-containing protein [Opitutales bacterium]